MATATCVFSSARPPRSLAQNRRGRFIVGRNFDRLIVREARRRLCAQREDQGRLLRQLVRVGQLNVAAGVRRREPHRLAEQDHARAGRIDRDGERQHAPILQGDFGRDEALGFEGRRRLRIRGRHRERIAALAARQLARKEDHVLDGEARDLIEPAALQGALGIACMDGETVEAPGSAKVRTAMGCGSLAAILLDQQRHRAGLDFLKRQLDLHLVGLELLPVDLEFLAGRIFQHDAVDAADAVGAKMHGILAADDQRRRVAGRQLPGRGMRVHQAKTGTVIRLESPIAAQRRLHAVAEHGRAQTRGIDDEAALTCIGDGGQFQGLAVAPGQAQRHVVRIAGGKHQRRALDRQHQGRSSRAIDLLRIHRVQRRQLRLLDGGKRHHQHRLGILERRDGVQRQDELVAARRCERGDVLILRGVKRVQDARDVKQRGDVRAVVAGAELRGVGSPASPDRCRAPRSEPPRSRCCAHRSI